MSRTVRRKSRHSKTAGKKKPIPPKWWIAIGAAVIAIYCLIHWLTPDNENQWTFIPRYGINLPLRYEVHGIDVSHHNAAIDWDRLAKNDGEQIKLDFVYIKATEGATHLDRNFSRNWKEAKRVGIPRGAYHFYNPRVLSEKQARNFIGTVRMEAGDLPPVLDLETYAGKPDDIIIRGVRNWLKIVEAHYGVRPVIYINEHFYEKYIADNFEEYPLWIAGYSRTHLNDLAGDPHVLFWQHNEKGRINGIRGFVDFNVYVHDRNTWQRFVSGTTHRPQH